MRAYLQRLHSERQVAAAVVASWDFTWCNDLAKFANPLLAVGPEDARAGLIKEAAGIVASQWGVSVDDLIAATGGAPLDVTEATIEAQVSRWQQRIPPIRVEELVEAPVQELPRRGSLPLVEVVDGARVVSLMGGVVVFFRADDGAVKATVRGIARERHAEAVKIARARVVEWQAETGSKIWLTN